MFGKYFKSSILVLPWLLLPLVVFAFFIWKVEPWIQENGYALRRESDAGVLVDAGVESEGELEYDEGLEYDGDEGFEEDEGFYEGEIDEEVGGVVYRWLYSSECFGLSAIIAIAINFILLLIIPCALGEDDGGVKRFQFYLGFFINLAVMIAMPIIYYLFYELDTTTFVILLALHAVAYMATFIIGSRFVSRSYRPGFWFA